MRAITGNYELLLEHPPLSDTNKRIFVLDNAWRWNPLPWIQWQPILRTIGNINAATSYDLQFCGKISICDALLGGFVSGITYFTVLEMQNLKNVLQKSRSRSLRSPEYKLAALLLF